MCSTGLPTKDETSETTVWNLYCLFPDIYGSLQLVILSLENNSEKAIYKDYLKDRGLNLTLKLSYLTVLCHHCQLEQAVQYNYGLLLSICKANQDHQMNDSILVWWNLCDIS